MHTRTHGHTHIRTDLFIHFVYSLVMFCFRIALNTVAQLKNVLRQASDEPTTKLKEYFQVIASFGTGNSSGGGGGRI